MGVSVVSLACPVCGAPFSVNDEKCGYCGSILVLRTDHPKITPASLNKQVIDERIADFRNDLRRDPHDSAAHYGLGVAYFNLRLTDDAVRELEEAARLMPENPNIQSQLAVALKQAADEKRPGAEDKLRDRIEYTLRLDPSNFDALLLKAENDSSLSDTKKIELLQQLQRVDATRAKPRLWDAYVQAAKAEKVQGSAREIELLRAANALDSSKTSRLLVAALTGRAKTLSASDPYADTVDSTRSQQAIEAWRDLSAFDPDAAQRELGQHLSFLSDLSKVDQRNLRKALENPRSTIGVTAPQQNLVSKATLTTQAAASSMVKPILLGALKGVGIVIAVFFSLGLIGSTLPEDSALSTLFAFIVLLSIPVAPIVMAVKEYRKANRGSREYQAATQPPSSTAHSQTALASSGQILGLLVILRSYFLDRWDREKEARIRLDKTGGGLRAERLRDKQFRSSLSTKR